MPLPRMTTRRWMIAVAVVAAALATSNGISWVLSRRAERFRLLAQAHGATVQTLARGKHGVFHVDPFRNIGMGTPSDEEFTPKQAGRVLWHLKLEEKYARAADHPWLPVPPDPPEPR